MSRSLFLLLWSGLFWSLSKLPLCHGYPMGAGSCRPGKNALGGAHLHNSKIGGGSLADYGLQVRLDGRKLSPDLIEQVQVGRDYNVELVATDPQMSFRGFLIRLESYIDTRETLRVPVGATDIQVSSYLCVAVEHVGGLTHTNSNDKTQVTGKLRVDEPAYGLYLDVTVVIRNTNGISEWYYSEYWLDAVQSPLTPVPTTGEPSMAPVTAAPSEYPTNIATDLPSSPPTFIVSSSPSTVTETPTRWPTGIPTLVPSDDPTSIPTLAASLAWSEAPSGNPTIFPKTPSPSDVAPSFVPTDAPTETASPPSNMPHSDPNPSKYSDQPSLAPSTVPSTEIELPSTHHPSNPMMTILSEAPSAHSPTEKSSSSPSSSFSAPTISPSEFPSMTDLSSMPTLHPQELDSNSTSQAVSTSTPSTVTPASAPSTPTNTTTQSPTPQIGDGGGLITQAPTTLAKAAPPKSILGPSNTSNGWSCRYANKLTCTTVVLGWLLLLHVAIV